VESLEHDEVERVVERRESLADGARLVEYLAGMFLKTPRTRPTLNQPTESARLRVFTLKVHS
jgi:hypothetical protein